ncbi:hypothetical protein DCS_03151 [Drechmeria coniospora]|uniref:Uncharacterized protein n=1 Tax=Drechmeria coniospora TaxID=98403 RepID=A0A151GY40_DRECN|nr:hypothetical protein DCS_03151 [Drechmeria coniospora]KYK62006.1 hypothetical protein DCS_03151 [Drechmeria coniospora]
MSWQAFWAVCMSNEKQLQKLSFILPTHHFMDYFVNMNTDSGEWSIESEWMLPSWDYVAMMNTDVGINLDVMISNGFL